MVQWEVKSGIYDIKHALGWITSNTITFIQQR